MSRDWSAAPIRFVDGCDKGQTVTRVRSPQGYPVAVRLAQIGAVALRNEGRVLVREWATVEPVVAMHTLPFGWEKIESLTRALKREGFRLLDTSVPKKEGKDYLTFECEPWRKVSANATLSEMTRLEKQALAIDSETPTLVDGRLAPRAGSFSLNDPVVGLIKTHSEPYLQTRKQWDTLYSLQSGQRTSAFTIETQELRVVSFYVRISGGKGGENLDNGIVRMELPAPYFETTLNEDWDCLDRLSGLITDYRCRDETYGRAAISIEPIVRAEENLGSLFMQADALISKFYNRALL